MPVKKEMYSLLLGLLKKGKSLILYGTTFAVFAYLFFPELIEMAIEKLFGAGAISAGLLVTALVVNWIKVQHPELMPRIAEPPKEVK